METVKTFIEPLLHKAEAYSKTSFEIVKLKALDKTATVVSTLISRLAVAVLIMFFVLALNIALALWLGDLLGKSYYGFLIIAAFYGIAAIIVFAVQPRLKTRLSNAIIKMALA